MSAAVVVLLPSSLSDVIDGAQVLDDRGGNGER
jgi:hypothetical protein